MNVTWLNVKDKKGVASFYDTCIILNTTAAVPFEYAYRVQIGIDDMKNVIIQPLPKEKVIRGDLDEYSLQKISIKKSYSRIASTTIMKKIAELLGLTLSKTPLKYVTKWIEEENCLIIKTGGNK